MWNINIQGIGSFLSGEVHDADNLAKEFIKWCEEKGHEVKAAVFSRVGDHETKDLLAGHVPAAKPVAVDHETYDAEGKVINVTPLPVATVIPPGYVGTQATNAAEVEVGASGAEETKLPESAPELKLVDTEPAGMTAGPGLAESEQEKVTEPLPADEVKTGTPEPVEKPAGE